MDKKTVSIVDYGLGNLFSVCQAIDKLGYQPILVQDPEKLVRADRLILPGVGAFARGMEELKSKHLDSALREYAKSGKPLLGICLGMQLLVDRGLEFGVTEGLKIIPGEVTMIPGENPSGKKVRVPHIGWNSIEQKYPAEPIFSGSGAHPMFYFVHSYKVDTPNSEAVFATADYEGIEITAMIRAGNVLGCQFHPERSGPAGLTLLENYLRLS